MRLPSHHMEVISGYYSEVFANAPFFISVEVASALDASKNDDYREITVPVGKTYEVPLSVDSVNSGLNFSGEKPKTPVLDAVNYPIHMKNLSIEELEALADELREEITRLGVADLTVAFHHVFNTPQDKIIWDVGHQPMLIRFSPEEDPRCTPFDRLVDLLDSPRLLRVFMMPLVLVTDLLEFWQP
ncbi:hypothetical protein Ahy_A06g025994 [Arachis hypogaea]|uniref:Uncharacterized protein n=1 Tax=Arachis hypogaea TaxID=3818 RepID=A0A445CJ61_ARAHY|nr:hypothetical protein Ahy_A06g025994 [Arachis hypogaea]